MFIQDEFPCSESSAVIEEIVKKNDVYQKGAILDIFLSDVVYLIFFPQRNIKSSRAIQPAVKDVR